MIVYNNIIPFKGYKAINICGIIFVRKSCNITKTLILHEKIHTRLILELFIIGFYLWYLIEWFINLFIYGNKAYRNIKFEKEAYTNQDDEMYLKKRKLYAFLKYY